MNRSDRTFRVDEIDLGPGILLLEASAGTGKTWSLTTLAARMLLEGRVEDVAEMLMVTFTRAATDDLRTRLRERLRETLRAVLAPDASAVADDPFLRRVAATAPTNARGVARLRRALRDFDRARVQTIHSWCARLLAETAFESGARFDLGEPADGSELRREALEDAWRATVVEGPAWIVGLAAARRWEPDDFEAAVREDARHARIRIRPEGPPWAEVEARVRSALERIEREVDPSEVLATIDDGVQAGAKIFLAEFRRKDAPRLLGALGSLAGAATDPATRAATWFLLADTFSGKKVWQKKTLQEVEATSWSGPLEELSAVAAEVEHALRTVLVAEARARSIRNKSREDRVDFDDLVARVRDALRDPDRRHALVRRVRETTKVALIDEFQDTDADQWEIFHGFFGEAATLVLVGDPKQAIYGFRGADVFAYLDARTRLRAEGGREYDLATNFRSHPGLVEAVNALFGAKPMPFAAEGIDHTEVRPHRTEAQRGLVGRERPAFDFVEVLLDEGNKDAHTEAVLAELVREVRRLTSGAVRLSSEGGAEGEVLGPGHVTVLTRSHHQSALVRDALRDAGIDAVLGRSGDVHASEAMEELGHLLEAVIDPRDPRVMRRAVATRLYGGRVSDLRRLDEDEEEMARTVEFLDDLRRAWWRYGVLVAMDRFLETRGVAARLLGQADGERLLTDLRHALELVHAAALDQDLSPLGTLHWLWRERERDHGQDERRQLRLDRDDDAVQIVTTHGSKGLEYDVVLVPFAWSGSAGSAPWTWHEVEDDTERTLIADFRTKLDDLEEEARRACARERMAEELRLLYVALTRAKRRCVVFWTPHHRNRDGGLGHTALAWLLHRPAPEPDEDPEDYVGRCLATLAGHPDAWTPTPAAWAEREGCIGVLESPTALVGREEWSGGERGSGSGNEHGSGRTPPPGYARALPADLAARLIPWSMVSFTGLVRRAEPVAHGAEIDGERDEVDDALEASVAERADPDDTRGLLRSGPAEGIFAFARGARAGVCLHEILEKSDFVEALDAAGRSRVEEILVRHGFDTAGAHPGRVGSPLEVATGLVTTVCRETFAGEDFRFGDLDRGHRLDEWEFRASLGRLRPRDLASHFERHGGEGLAARAAARLRRLQDLPVEGLLGGFVDLVFEHGGRWFLVDWKSNHLGDHPEDYDRAAVEGAMLEHDYLLQLTLYTVALHRFLGLRLGDYDYDRHFGRAGYVFLRGLCGRPDRGWFDWRPPRALVESLDAVLAGRRA